MSGVRASVIIPSFQSAATIEPCLRGVLSQQLDGGYEVILVDSGRDGAAALVARSFPSVRVMHSDARLDPAAARNLGVTQARGRVVVFIDADCTPAAGWLSQLCALAETEGFHGAGGSIVNHQSDAVSWAGYFCEFREFLPEGPRRTAANLTLGNAAYRRDAFERAGGFPVGFFPQEDQRFHSTFTAAGGRLWYDPSIQVVHRHRDSLNEFLGHQRRIGAANARVVQELSLRGKWLASRPRLAALVFPFVAAYRFCRTLASCWRFERSLMLRRPTVTVVCWMGMLAWGTGFARIRMSRGESGG